MPFIDIKIKALKPKPSAKHVNTGEEAVTDDTPDILAGHPHLHVIRKTENSAH